METLDSNIGSIPAGFNELQQIFLRLAAVQQGAIRIMNETRESIAAFLLANEDLLEFLSQFSYAGYSSQGPAYEIADAFLHGCRHKIEIMRRGRHNESGFSIKRIRGDFAKEIAGISNNTVSLKVTKAEKGWTVSLYAEGVLPDEFRNTPDFTTP